MARSSFSSRRFERLQRFHTRGQAVQEDEMLQSSETSGTVTQMTHQNYQKKTLIFSNAAVSTSNFALQGIQRYVSRIASAFDTESLNNTRSHARSSAFDVNASINQYSS